jgi:hypothetical protein
MIRLTAPRHYSFLRNGSLIITTFDGQSDPASIFPERKIEVLYDLGSRRSLPLALGSLSELEAPGQLSSRAVSRVALAAFTVQISTHLSARFTQHSRNTQLRTFLPSYNHCNFRPMCVFLSIIEMLPSPIIARTSNFNRSAEPHRPPTWGT